MKNGYGNSAVGDHQIEELGKWSGRCFESSVAKEVRVVRPDNLQNVRTTEDDCKMFGSVSVILCISDCSSAHGFDFLQAIFGVQIRTEILWSAVTTLVTPESGVFQRADNRLVAERCANFIREVLENVKVDVRESFGRHVRGRFHEILGRDDLELFITDGARVIFLDLQLVC